MIPVGSRVKIRAICHRDAFYCGGRVTCFVGRVGTVISPNGLRFDIKDATFAGEIRLDYPLVTGGMTDFYFNSIQVKKLKEN